MFHWEIESDVKNTMFMRELRKLREEIEALRDEIEELREELNDLYELDPEMITIEQDGTKLTMSVETFLQIHKKL